MIYIIGENVLTTIRAHIAEILNILCRTSYEVHYKNGSNEWYSYLKFCKKLLIFNAREKYIRSSMKVVSKHGIEGHLVDQI